MNEDAFEVYQDLHVSNDQAHTCSCARYWHFDFEERGQHNFDVHLFFFVIESHSP